MNIRQLETLVAINDHQGFKRAASVLNITPSAISMQMRALETELNAELFDRRSRPPTLNAKGRELLGPVREILTLCETVRLMATSSTELAGQIELGVVQSAMISLLPVARAVLERRYPGLRIRIVSGLSSELLNKVTEGSLGAAIITQPNSFDRQIRCETLLEEHLVIICHKMHGKPSMKMLSELPFIRFNRRIGVGRIIEREIHRHNLRVQDAMEADTIDGILTMIASGYGVAIVPQYSLLSHYRRSIHSAVFGRPPAKRKLALVISKRAELMPIVDALLEGLSVAVKALQSSQKT